MKDKIDSIIGFALRARKVIFGTDNLKNNKNINLIICCKSLGDNSFKQLKALANNRIPLVVSHKLLEDITYKKGVKAIGIKDKQMSKAILNNLTENFILVQEERSV